MPKSSHFAQFPRSVSRYLGKRPVLQRTCSAGHKDRSAGGSSVWRDRLLCSNSWGTRNVKRLLSLSISMCLAVVALSATAAFARPDVVLHLSGATVERTSSGEKVTPLVPDQKLKAGEVVRWTIAGTNKGSDPALHFTPSDKIPAGTAYIAGSASTAGGRVEFSLDE